MGSVSYEDVYTLRNRVGPDVLVPIILQGLVAMAWRAGAAIYAEAPAVGTGYSSILVLEVDYIIPRTGSSKRLRGCRRVGGGLDLVGVLSRIEQEVMVASKTTLIGWGCA